MVEKTDMIDKYLSNCKAKYSPATYEDYKYILKKFERHLNGTPIEEVSISDVRQFLNDLKAEGLASSSLSIYLSKLKSFYQFVEESNGCETPNLDKINPKNYRREDREGGRGTDVTSPARENPTTWTVLGSRGRASGRQGKGPDADSEIEEETEKYEEKTEEYYQEKPEETRETGKEEKPVTEDQESKEPEEQHRAGTVEIRVLETFKHKEKTFEKGEIYEVLPALSRRAKEEGYAEEMTEEKKHRERVEQVCEWAQATDGETSEVGPREEDFPFYWSELMERYRKRVQDAPPGSLVEITGLGGTGKTEFLFALGAQLEGAHRVELPLSPESSWNRELTDITGLKDIYEQEIIWKVKDKGKAEAVAKELGRPGSDLIDLLMKYKQDEGMGYLLTDLKDALKDRLTKKELQEAWRKALVDWGISYEEGKCDYILINLRDYPKGSYAAMHKDLDEIRSFWQDMVSQDRSSAANLIYTVQEEKFGQHSLEGKATVLELEPLKPDELVEAYRETWGSPEPFTQEALALTAKKSGGNFRRFKESIVEILEPLKWSGETVPIEKEDVEEALGLEAVLEGRGEISKIFRSDRKVKEAARTVSLLQSKEKIPQKNLAQEAFEGGDDVRASRVLIPLESHDIVQRETGRDGRKFVMLNEEI